jgi:NTE family protein
MGLFRKRKIALVLGGGSARGLCNIGVLKVLEKHFGRDNMPFDMIVGTSIGSFIGAAYSLGVTPEEMEERSLKFTLLKLVDIGMHPTGLIKGDKLESIIIDTIGTNKGFEDMKYPFALTTTDIETGEELVHTSGDLIKLIRASCSWPAIFSAVEINGRLLADGGVRNSIPTKAACKMGATFVLAVNPGFAVKNQKINSLMQATVQMVQIMGEELNAYQAKVADVVIKPDLMNIDQFDFDKGEVIIKQGEIAAEEAIPKLKRKLFFHR